MSVLWVTSFNSEIYEASGKNLLFSFTEKNVEGNFFIGKEGHGKYNQESLIPCFNGFMYNLDESIFMETWLYDNKDIIPESLGGTAKPCHCRDPWARSSRDHATGCHFSWFNRNASRWFRKIATLHAALEYYTHRHLKYIIWIDADCEFKQKISEDFIMDVIFNKDEADIAYLRGRKRRFLEAGLVGYNIQKHRKGLLAITRLIEIYESGNFRKLKEWDDCHCLESIMADGHFNEHDLATTISGKYSEVFPNSLIGEHITHNKGRHGRKLGIMK